MGARARERQSARELVEYAEGILAAEVERAEAIANARPEDVFRLEGRCDVCDELISYIGVHPWLGDYAFDEHNAFYTWLYHSAGPDPDCRRYASVVRKVAHLPADN